MSKLAAIILDFDGVIADTEPLHFRAFHEVLADEGVELTAADYAAHYLGLADSEVFKALAGDRGLALDATRLQWLLARKAGRYEALAATGARVIPGVADKLREWNESLPLAVASGARRVEIESVLGAAGLLSCFRTIVGAEDVARGKPAPDPYLAALATINEAEGQHWRKAGLASGWSDESGRRRGPARIGAWQVVAVEDSPTGLTSIRAAGMRAVAVTTNFPASALARGADLVVGSLEELDLARLQLLLE